MKNGTKLNIALIGSPNSGKTSLFNQLTGLNQHVGNYDGVTIDKKVGETRHNGNVAQIIDLPGTYSLYPIAEDERVVLSMLLNKSNKDYPDLILFIANAGNLKKGMLLLSQLTELNIPIVFCLNMMDLADDKGLSINIHELESKLNIPVVLTNAKKGLGLDKLKTSLFADFDNNTKGLGKKKSANLPSWIDEVKKLTNIESDYAAMLALCDYKKQRSFSADVKNELDRLISEKEFKPIVAEVEDKKHRLKEVNDILSKVVRKDKNAKVSFTDKLDLILTHNIYGTIILVLLLFLIFQGVFSFSSFPMDLIDETFGSLNSYLGSILPDTWWQRLLTEGIITGIGGIVIFIPQIAILFGLVAVLEESGYMPRAVYLSDRLMSKFGLNGRSLVSFISGIACAVPAIMAARTISNKKERLITIFVTPFISCSARLPVYVVLTAFIVPDEKFLGIFNLPGLVLFGLYFLGFFAALATSFILHKIFKTDGKSILALDLPSYQIPSFKNVLITLVEKTKIFVFDAGKVILIISIILWALVSYGPGDNISELEEQSKIIMLDDNNEEALSKIASQKLEYSYAGYLGKGIEPVIRPLGFDWKMGIALITSFAAREVFVSTMATIYSAGNDDEKTIRERMRDQRDYLTGEKTYTPARSFSLLIFYVFAMQCMSTVAITKRETKSWMIAIAQLLFMTGVAYISSYIVFNFIF
ncbi:MAG: ferrous iron transport protein B [Flavobacteriales bacterium]|jgi:ferrous iron transport protein B